MKIQKRETSEVLEEAKLLLEHNQFWNGCELLRRFGFECVGDGTSRVVYEIPNSNFVLKVQNVLACPTGGLIQNKHEVIVCQKFADHPFVPRILGFDSQNYSWIEMEYLEEIDHYKYLPKNQEISAFAKMLEPFHYDPYDDFVSPIDEYLRMEHWGVDELGNIKLLDLGV